MILTAQHLRVGTVKGGGHEKLARAIRRHHRHVYHTADRGCRTPFHPQGLDADGDFGDGRRREQLLADPLTTTKAHIDRAIDDELRRECLIHLEASLVRRLPLGERL